MCGIAGLARAEALGSDDRAVVTRMTGSLAHRGPDGDGFCWHGGVGLGHRRLSIIDLAGGDQPIYNEDRTVCVVFNGEIYNYRELQQQLRDRGHQLATNSDTEVIVHLYEDHGDQLLEHLNGMFAFALWDLRQNRLLLARDRLGEKPLYYWAGDGEIAFASELKALLKHPKVSRDIDPASLDDYLAYGYVPAPRCILKGVAKLPPAHLLSWQGGEVRSQRYWSIPPVHAGDGAVTEGDLETWTGQFRDLLDDSIALRLRSDVPVGAFLSGGIDSGLMVALASRHLEQPLSTYSVRFRDLGFDEAQYAREVASRCGTRHNEITVDQMEFDVLPDLVRQYDEPFADPSSLPTWYVTREASRHLKVCISGDAGDELFGGYTRYAAEPGSALTGMVPRALRQPVLDGMAGLLPRSMKGMGFLRRLAVDGAERYQRGEGIFAPWERKALRASDCAFPVQEEAWLYREGFAAVGGIEPQARMLADQHSYLSEDILVKVDRASMMNSLEVRVPLLDHRIVEFANGLPLGAKIRNGEQKVLLRRVLFSLLPRDLFDRPKHGFGMPLGDWFRGSQKSWLMDHLGVQDSPLHEYIDRGAVHRLITAHMAGGRDFSHQLWALLWLDLWIRQLRA